MSPLDQITASGKELKRKPGVIISLNGDPEQMFPSILEVITPSKKVIRLDAGAEMSLAVLKNGAEIRFGGLKSVEDNVIDKRFERERVIHLEPDSMLEANGDLFVIT